MKLLILTLSTLLAGTFSFAQSYEYSHTNISKSESYIEITELIETEGAYEVNFKVEAPNYAIDNEGVRHGALSLNLIKNRKTNKICLRANKTNAYNVFMECTNIGSSVSRCTPVIEDRNNGIAIGPKIILKKDIIYTGENLNSDKCQ